MPNLRTALAICHGRPHVRRDYLAHDAYTCDGAAWALAYPTQRPDNYQHVGQVNFPRPSSLAKADAAVVIRTCFSDASHWHHRIMY